MTTGFFFALIGALVIGQALSNAISVVAMHALTRLVVKRQLKKRGSRVDIDGLLRAFQAEHGITNGVEGNDPSNP